jgi:hypothetical protein
MVTLETRRIMLHSYQAELNGSQLIWIDQPPMSLSHQRVVVVVEAQELANQPNNGRMQGFLKARGCMGRASREQILVGLDALREDWSRNPLDTSSGHPS